MTGTVIKSTGSNYLVRENGDGTIIPCKIRGKLRLDGNKSTNPVAVGDIVDYDMETSGDVGVISNIHKRQNCIVRRATNLSRQSQVIAANIDQCLIVTTLIMPETPLEFIDRFLVSAEAYKVTPIIVFNKCDLCKDEGVAEELQRRIDLYTKIGYRCHCTSSVTGEGIDTLRDILRDKTTLLSGRSGTGKSTLVNTVNPGLNLRTGEISMSSLDGKHTTTFAEMFPLSFGGYVVDTPGIRSFGTSGLSNEDVAHNFPDFFSRLSECRFYNCTHTNEPGCAVKAAVESGEIEPSRYESYISICFGEDGKYREGRRGL
jgi:ribosome biogenesis GTPase